MDEPAGSGFLFNMTPFGALPLGSKIDNVAHEKLDGNRIVCWANLACYACKQVRSVVDDGSPHFEPAEIFRDITAASLAIAFGPGKTRLLEREMPQRLAPRNDVEVFWYRSEF